MSIPLLTISLVIVSFALAGISIGNHLFATYAEEDIGTVVPNPAMQELDKEFNTNTTETTSNQTSGINATSFISASDSQFTAESVFNTNSLVADKDVTEVVILMPDNKIIGKKFIPSNITIAPQTTVLWINGQNAVNGITLYDGKGTQIFSNSTIPFANATSYDFTHKGVYRFTSTADPSVNGTIQVVSAKKLADISQTNATTYTIGLLAAPAAEKEFWNFHLNKLGFNVKSIYDYPIPNVISSKDGESDEDQNATLYLYTQKLSKYSSIVDRVGVKLHNVEKQVAKLD